MDIQQLIGYDKEAFLALNGGQSLFWDGFMWIFTSTYIWIPLALALIYIIIKNNRGKQILLIICMIVLVILLADRISSGFFKPFFQRFRPSQDPEFMYLVDLVNGYRGGKYGFISSHAANSFGIFTFIALLFRKKEFSLILLIWALLTSYSRIYLGVHYPGDIICGAVVGVICGCLVYILYFYLNKNFFSPKLSMYISDKFTSTKYLVSDINIATTVLFSTYVLIMVYGMIISGIKYI